MKNLDIESFKKMMTDDLLDLSVGTIQSLDLASDRSALFVRVKLLMDDIEINARMSWESVGADSGHFQFPVINDLVIVGYVDGHEDSAFVVRRLTTSSNKIPIQAIGGDMVNRSLAGKQNHVLSDTAVLLGRGGADPTEQIVLGNVFQTAYSSHLGELSKQADTSSKHKHIGNMGFFTAPPDLASDFSSVKSAAEAIKASPVDDSGILSDLSKTEK